jgi:hypothetical protein
MPEVAIPSYPGANSWLAAGKARSFSLPIVISLLSYRLPATGYGAPLFPFLPPIPQQIPHPAIVSSCIVFYNIIEHTYGNCETNDALRAETVSWYNT